jgi:hypothetical protein
MVAVNRGLARKLEAFGADPRATDAARLLRVTGTMRGSARRMVEVIHLEQRDRRAITYHLHAFAEGIVPRSAEAPAAGIIPRPAAEISLDARRGYRVVRPGPALAACLAGTCRPRAGAQRPLQAPRLWQIGRPWVLHYRRPARLFHLAPVLDRVQRALSGPWHLFDCLVKPRRGDRLGANLKADPRKKPKAQGYSQDYG